MERDRITSASDAIADDKKIAYSWMIEAMGQLQQVPIISSPTRSTGAL